MQNTSQVDDIGEVLKDWGCDDSVIEVFKDNQIGINQLPLLNAELLKEMVPKMGPRMLLLEKLKEMRQHEEDNLEHRECSASTVTQSEFSDISTIDGNESISIVLATNEDPHINTDMLIENELLNFLKPKFEDFDLKTLLTTSPLGKSIINYYASNKKLDNTRRNRLVTIIVKHLYNYIVKNRLTQEDYNTLGAKIISLFPMETLGIYYCPPIRKSDHPLNRSIMAKGKLVNHVRNILFRSGDTCSRRSITSKRSFQEMVEEKENDDKNRDDVMNIEDTVWLQHNNEPWTKVIEKWRNTFQCRKNTVAHNLNEYFLNWPILNDLRAYVLINLDFEQLYPQSQIAFHLNWESFFDTVLKNKINEIKDITAQNIYKQLLDKNNEDEKLPLQLTLLNYMLPPRGRTKNWKFSILESIEGIILHVQNPGDVQARVDACIEKAYERKQTVQPYLVVEGDTLDTIKTTLIVFDKVKYQFQSVKEAFDLLFKSYHVMNLKYPPQSAHIFQLIQNGVYNIATKYDVTYPENLEILRLSKE